VCVTVCAEIVKRFEPILRGNRVSTKRVSLLLVNSVTNITAISRSLLVVPRPRDSKTKWYGQQAFRYVTPSLWNVLPESIKEKDSIQSFRPSLKCNCVCAPVLVCVLSEVDVAIITLCVCVCVCVYVCDSFFCYHYL